MQATIVNYVRPKGVFGAVVLALLILAGIAFLDYFTGNEVSFSIWYLVAVGVATWFGGRTCGLWIAVLSAIVWFALERLQGVHYSQPWIPYWNALVRLGFFVIVCLLLSKIRALTSNLEGAVRKQTAALTSEIAVRERLEHDIINISESERERLGQDLHDEVAQDLVGIACSVDLLVRRLEQKSLPEAVQAREITGLVDRALTEVRNVARGLFPATLRAEGLSESLAELCQLMSDSFKIECRLVCEGQVDAIEPGAAIHLYRIAQEAANNAVKHGRATQVTITLRAPDGLLKMSIADNGLGIPEPLPRSTGMGLQIMDYRARCIGAEINIARRDPERGTLLAVELDRHNGVTVT